MWNVKNENKLNDNTKVSEADNKIEATMQDLEKYVNGTAPYVGLGINSTITTYVDNKFNSDVSLGSF